MRSKYDFTAFDLQKIIGTPEVEAISDQIESALQGKTPEKEAPPEMVNQYHAALINLGLASGNMKFDRGLATGIIVGMLIKYHEN